MRYYANVVYHEHGKQLPSAPKKKPKKQSVVSGLIGDRSQLAHLPKPGLAEIQRAEFIKSSVSVKDCPKEKYPEFAVVGRSNVGKSSLINLLTQRKNLALISKTPGKTRCINHFLINDRWYLVDLPGYGFSKVDDSTRMDWNQFTRDYFVQRTTLANVLLLIDASIPPIEIDLFCAQWLKDSEVPFTVVFTKVDKRKEGHPVHNIELFRSALSRSWKTIPVCFATSARFGDGREPLLRYISQLTRLFASSTEPSFGMGKHYSSDELESIRKRIK